jgi:hypothetical protein
MLAALRSRIKAQIGLVYAYLGQIGPKQKVFILFLSWSRFN